MKHFLRVLAFSPLFLFLILADPHSVQAAGWYGPGYDKIRDLPVAKLDTGSWFEVQGPGLNYNFSRANPDSMANYIRSYVQGKVTRAAVVESSLSGYASPQTDTLRCFADSNHADIYLVAGITGTSDDTVFTFGHAPVACRPSHTLTLTALVTNSNVQRVSKVTLSPAGVFVVYAADTDGVLSATAFAASNTKGIVLSASYSKY